MYGNLKSIRLAALAVLAITAVGQATAAQLSATVPQVSVSYADLNLDQAAGAATLYARIQRAAAKVCPEVDRSNIAGEVRRNACLASAIQRAVATVGAPELTRYYAARKGKAPRNSSLAAAGQ
jgi:UrcA family protein